MNSFQQSLRGYKHHSASYVLCLVFQYDIEFKGDNFTQKKSLDMLTKCLRKEVHNLGITWSHCGKQNQNLCVSYSIASPLECSWIRR